MGLNKHSFTSSNRLVHDASLGVSWAFSLGLSSGFSLGFSWGFCWGSFGFVELASSICLACSAYLSTSGLVGSFGGTFFLPLLEAVEFVLPESSVWIFSIFLAEAFLVIGLVTGLVFGVDDAFVVFLVGDSLGAFVVFLVGESLGAFFTEALSTVAESKLRGFSGSSSSESFEWNSLGISSSSDFSASFSSSLESLDSLSSPSFLSYLQKSSLVVIIWVARKLRAVVKFEGCMELLKSLCVTARPYIIMQR